MSNPFYLQEIPVDAPFCDREGELKELQSYAEAKANVVLFSPRRYGKTSLVKRVQKKLAEKGAVSVFADLFGVSSVDDVAARLARSVFAVTHQKEPLWKSALRIIRTFRPVLKPDISGHIALSVERSSAGKSGLPLLEETMESLGEFIHATKPLVQVTLDEFQEIVILKEALQIEAALRTQINQHRASYFFVGSRRRILLGIFNERQRPFFQSAINYPIGTLPAGELAEFIARQFAENKKNCTGELAREMASVVECHPYYSQKLAFFVYESCKTVTANHIQEGFDTLILSEKPVFEAAIQCLPPHQRLLLQALSREPAQKLLASSFVQKHNLGSVGGIQHSAKQLEDLDLIEKDEEKGFWRLVDPVFALWLRMQREEKL
jgi:hypothetical protein